MRGLGRRGLLRGVAASIAAVAAKSTAVAGTPAAGMAEAGFGATLDVIGSLPRLNKGFVWASDADMLESVLRARRAAKAGEGLSKIAEAVRKTASGCRMGCVALRPIPLGAGDGPRGPSLNVLAFRLPEHEEAGLRETLASTASSPAITWTAGGAQEIVPAVGNGADRWTQGGAGERVPDA